MFTPSTTDRNLPPQRHTEWDLQALRIAVVLGCCSVLAGLSTLAGWAMDIQRLTDWEGSGISMMPNTAVAAVVAGVALVLLVLGRRWGAAALGLFAALVGATALFEHFSGVDLGIDRLLFHREWGHGSTVAPGRMSPPGAISFTLIGTGLAFATSSRSRRRVAIACAMLVMSIALLSLIGYLFRASTLYSIPHITAIALQTATMTLALGLGLACALPQQEPMRTLLARSAAGALARRALPLIVILPVVLGKVQALGQDAGMFDTEFGTAALVLTLIILQAALLWWAVAKLAAHERELRRRTNQLSLFLETAAIGLHRIGHDGIVLWVNEAELQLLGYAQDEYVGHHISEFHADQDVIAEILARLASGEKLHEYPARMKCKDGSIKDVAIDSNVLFEQGRFIHTQCFTRDVTERKRVDELQASLAAIVEASDDAIISKTLDGTIRSWNSGAERLFGYTADEAVGQSIELIVPPELRGEERTILDQLRNGERITHFETVRISKQGRRIDISLTVSPIRNSAGRIIGASKVARDVSERKRTYDMQVLLGAIVEASDDAIVGKSLEGIIHAWNGGAERLFGYSADEAVGQSIELIIPPDLRAEEQVILDKLKRGERITHFETVRVSKQGRRIDISLTISPIRDSTGRIVGASKVARDISQRKQHDAEREQLLESERAARTLAEQAGRLKDEFLATVSHELRTPLNGILGWAQFLKRAKHGEASIAEGVDAIERGARMQAQIIDDLLDINRIVSGKLRLEVQDTELAPVIEAALETVHPSAEAKNIRIHTVLNPGAGPIKGDPTRLQQVIWNLLSNAVKFTPKDGNVQVLLERVDSHVEISVADTGIGIKPEFAPHVFERFRQADSSTSRQYGGLGLGLAIVKQIVELHGGTVSVASEGEGRGSTFQIRLPISAVRGPPQFEPQVFDESPGLDLKFPGIRILVVDDDPGACEVLQRLLDQSEAVVDTIGSGREALDRILESGPDLLLCDIGMPGMDGFELIRAIRECGLTIPAIAITAFAREPPTVFGHFRRGLTCIFPSLSTPKSF